MFVFQGVVDGSTDVDLLWAEIKAARDVLIQIQNMRQGRLGDTAVTVESEVILHKVTLKHFGRQSQRSTVSELRYSEISKNIFYYI